MNRVVGWLVMAGCIFVMASAVSLAGGSMKEPKKEFSKQAPATLAAEYRSSKDLERKVEILNTLAGASSGQLSAHKQFYELLRTAESDEITYFRKAMRDSGSIELLLNIGPYLKGVKEPFLKRAKANPDMTDAQKIELIIEANKEVAKLQENIEELAPEFRLIAEKNPKALVRTLLDTYSKAEEESDDSFVAGPMIGLLAMKEDGAAAWLKEMTRDTKPEGLVYMLAKAFGPNVVIPALKQKENPASTKEQKDLAGLVIFCFDDSEPVYDKVAEAYRHGRYFERDDSDLKKDKDGKIVLSLADMLKMAGGWWGNDIRGRYRGDEKFATYVAKKYLDEEKGQEKIIELLSDIHIEAALPYFLELDPAKLSDESIDALLQATYLSPSSPLSSLKRKGEKDSTAAKFQIYRFLFKALDADKRKDKKVIYSLSRFPADYQLLFLKACIGILTEEEKTTIVYLCGKDRSGGLLRSEMPASTRKEILDIIRKDASKKLLETIEFIEREK